MSKDFFHRQSVIKYSAKSDKMKQNWTNPGICIWYLDLYKSWQLLPKIDFSGEHWTLVRVYKILRFSFPFRISQDSQSNVVGQFATIVWHLVFGVCYTRYHVSLDLSKIKLSWKRTKLQRYYVTIIVSKTMGWFQLLNSKVA